MIRASVRVVSMAPAQPESPRSLGTFQKVVYGMGDHGVSLTLTALSMFFLFFLTEVAGLRPSVAGAVIWFSRLFDAISDPLIGRYSDTRKWKMGRRRPFLLIGMLPFALFFALLWRVPFDATESQTAAFIYYTTIYMALSLATTILSVPYLALLPEMARDYHERTSLNAFRAAGAVSGTLFAVGMRFLADRWGGDAAAYAAASSLFGVWLLVPWIPVFRVAFERPGESPPPPPPLMQSVREIARHKSFTQLSALFVAARIAVDLAAAGLAYYTAYWLGRSGDLVPAMLVLLLTSVISLPIWLRIGQRVDKHRMFIAGASLWAVLLLAIFLLPQGVARPTLFVLLAISGFGYCAADLIPWAMIGEVIDEAELTSGHRLEGIYNGFFMFLRKIAGATGVALMALGIEAAGFVANQPQTDAALLAIRIATALAPACFLIVAILIATNFPLTRAAHERIRTELEARSR